MTFQPDPKANKAQLIERLTLRFKAGLQKEDEGSNELTKAQLTELEKKAEGLLKRLIPGEYKSSSHILSKGCGQCDGVIFLREKYRFELKEQKKIKDPKTGQEYIHTDQSPILVADSAELRALRYVKPMGEQWHFDNGWDRPGICKPHDIHFALTPEMQQISKEQNRLLGWLFRADDKGINANQPEHRSRWLSFQVEKDIWAILYV